MKRWRAVLIATLIAASVGSCMAYVAGQHNPEGEFSNHAGELSMWLLFSRVFIWYFVPVFLISLVIGIAVRAGGKSRG